MGFQHSQLGQAWRGPKYDVRFWGCRVVGLGIWGINFSKMHLCCTEIHSSRKASMLLNCRRASW